MCLSQVPIQHLSTFCKVLYKCGMSRSARIIREMNLSDDGCWAKVRGVEVFKRQWQWKVHRLGVRASSNCPFQVHCRFNIIQWHPWQLGVLFGSTDSFWLSLQRASFLQTKAIGFQWTACLIWEHMLDSSKLISIPDCLTLVRLQLKKTDRC